MHCLTTLHCKLFNLNLQKVPPQLQGCHPNLSKLYRSALDIFLYPPLPLWFGGGSSLTKCHLGKKKQERENELNLTLKFEYLTAKIVFCDLLRKNSFSVHILKIKLSPTCKKVQKFNFVILEKYIGVIRLRTTNFMHFSPLLNP